MEIVQFPHEENLPLVNAGSVLTGGSPKTLHIALANVDDPASIPTETANLYASSNAASAYYMLTPQINTLTLVVDPDALWIRVNNVNDIVQIIAT